ncbi:hypothetical protein HYALB_00010296 [Hymenoscyphus albidus]|uniref:Uncharacterized protein n=1 Tax=Hymenoscyphus albidus TaxID=595503 RepID=A0A9N9LRU1_9HELO|nr:hypothetical protein HYALB_00010296 [Hymenoscyphus albidus]
MKDDDEKRWERGRSSPYKLLLPLTASDVPAFTISQSGSHDSRRATEAEPQLLFPDWAAKGEAQRTAPATDVERLWIGRDLPGFVAE